MEINLHVDGETVEELLEAGLRDEIVDIARSEIPDMDDYFEKGDADDFVHRGGFEADVADMLVDMLTSMPSEPTSRCRLGEAFTAAVERVVFNSLDVTTRIRYVAEHLAPAPVASPPAEQDRTDMVREVLVVPMSGDRNDVGTATVWTNADDTEFEVRRGSRWTRHTTACAAFNEAFSGTGWGRLRVYPTSA